MAVNLEQIGKWLDAKEFNYHHDVEGEVIILKHGNDETTQMHLIRAREDGEVFDWKMNILDENNDVLKIKDHEHESKVLPHMLYMNFTTKFGTWEYDPKDGEVCLAVEVPLEDALMTAKQFNRIFGFMTKNGQEGADAVRSLLATGEVKEVDEDAEMIAKLEAMLAVLKKGDSSSSSEDSI